MQISLTFNGYQEMRNFCQQIIGVVTEQETTAKVTAKVKEPEKKQEKALDEKPAKKRGRKSTISDEKKAEILKYYNGGYSVKEIASLVGISSSSIFRTINKK